MSVHRQTIINTHESQTEFVTHTVGEMDFCIEAKHKNSQKSPICSGRIGLDVRASTGMTQMAL